MKDALVPDSLFFDDTVCVPVRWRCRGFKQGTAEITLTLAGAVVARKEIALQEGEDLREELTFTPRPSSGGGHEKAELKTAIRYRGKEAFTEDNELTRTVALIDRKVKILYMEGSPRWQYKFLQTALLRDRRVDPKFLLVSADKRATASDGPYLPAMPGARQDLFSYDLLILGDVPLSSLGLERAGWIRDFVREGGSLIFIAGRQHAPSEYGSTPLAEVLPIEFASSRFTGRDLDRPQMYVPLLTRAGERSEMLTLADTPEESHRVWQSLPGFYWNYPVTKLRPGASALLVHPRPVAGEQAVPVLASHFYGKGQVLFLGTDESWRWRANGGEKLFARFWGQVIYQMGLPHLVGSPKRVQLALEKSDNVLNKPSSVFARVFDAEFRPYTGSKVNGRLERIDAKPGEQRSVSVVLDPVPALPGEYRVVLPNDAVGRFLMKISEPSGASLEYKVGLPPQHELQVASMDAEGLRSA
ncbi:MAG: hypothetical protein L0170_16655, partial [Acidobacteria bacterium]|nr:hypothetical protein [Acidobacteriota bacterium]